jgi:uncharacterized protein (TIGR00255 family)
MIYSMTAFASNNVQNDWGSATWEIKAVNHRYFDCSMKIPDFLRPLEIDLRYKAKDLLQRGRIECYLKYVANPLCFPKSELNVNLLKNLNSTIAKIKEYIPETAAVDPIKVLNFPNVITSNEETSFKDVEIIIVNLFNKTIEDLIKSREREGLSIKALIINKINLICDLTKTIHNKVPQSISNYTNKLSSHLYDLKNELNQQRLEQEMVLFAQKIDITEELERIEIHSREVIRVLEEGGGVGKRLDFLLQELNREANTIASKSTDTSIITQTVELKVIIEQIREQIQNLV